MRGTTTSSKRNSSSNSSGSSVRNAANQHQRKSAKGSTQPREWANQDTEATTAKDQSKTVQDESQNSSREQQQQHNHVGSLSSIAFECDDFRKQNHCEIEKRRRDKMNHYLMELASAIPNISTGQSKFDKLTVLRMAVQHVKSLRSSLCTFSSFHLRPSFLSSGNILKNLILQMAGQESQDNLFMVVTCDRGKVLFVSQSSKNILNQDQDDLVGQCLFDMLHKDDVFKVKEQISYSGMMPKEMLVDSRTLQPIKRRQSFSQIQNQVNSTPQPGARRSFFCRMRGGRNGQPVLTNILTSSVDQKDVTQDRTNNAGKMNNQSDSIVTDSFYVNKTNKDSEPGDENSRIRDLLFQQRNISRNSHSSNDSGLYRANSSSNIDTTSSSPDNNREFNTQNNSPETSKFDDSSVSKANKSKDYTNSSSGDGNTSNSSISSGSCRIKINRAERRKISSNCSSSANGIASGSQSSINEQSSSAESDPSSKLDKRSNNMKAYTSAGVGAIGSKKQSRYIVMHCTGYLKSITLKNDEFYDDDFDYCTSESNNSDDEENDNYKTINCMVAVCRRSPINRDLKPDRPLTFTCRYSMEGKFMFVDQRTTVALGYTPQQLLGTSHYAYCHKDSVNTFKECHRQSILKSETISSDIYQFKRANGQYIWLQTSLKCFRNPWTKFIDYIVANHTTAEGSNPKYNEGCVPTKFNQDMTGGEVSQSSSPASSSSLSLPSTDSKKSSSPSSSSMGSSYSMDSYASGGNIQALLNQIDRVKSGPRHTLDFHKKRSHNYLRSDEGSARKCNEDGGSYSDPQSCSSLSSQNSAVSADSMNYQGRNKYYTTTSDQELNNSIRRDIQSNQKSGMMMENNCTQNNYQLVGLQINNTIDQPNLSINTSNPKADPRSGGKSGHFDSMKQYQRQCRNDYPYRSQVKSGQFSSSNMNESGLWNRSGGSVYSDSSGHQSGQSIESDSWERVNSVSSGSTMCGMPIQNRSCQTINNMHQQPQYIVQTPSVNLEQVPVTIRDQLGNVKDQSNDRYSGNVMPVPLYVNQNIDSRYTDNVNLNQVHPISGDPQDIIPLTIQQRQQPEQYYRSLDQGSHQVGESNLMNIPVMWNTTNLNTIYNPGNEQICNGDVSLMNMKLVNSNNQTAVAAIHCPQCANHKCFSRQSMMSNSTTDLNSINLTSLMVDGDLDEDQLLEYLSGVNSQHYTQDNAYS